jgi:hypothetical protein
VAIEEVLQVSAPLAALGLHHGGDELNMAILAPRKSLGSTSTANDSDPLAAGAADGDALGL